MKIRTCDNRKLKGCYIIESSFGTAYHVNRKERENYILKKRTNEISDKREARDRSSTIK